MLVHWECGCSWHNWNSMCLFVRIQLNTASVICGSVPCGIGAIGRLVKEIIQCQGWRFWTTLAESWMHIPVQIVKLNLPKALTHVGPAQSDHLNSLSIWNPVENTSLFSHVLIFQLNSKFTEFKGFLLGVTCLNKAGSTYIGCCLLNPGCPFTFTFRLRC